MLFREIMNKRHLHLEILPKALTKSLLYEQANDSIKTSDISLKFEKSS